MERRAAGPVSRRRDRPVLHVRLQPRSSRKGVIECRDDRIRFAVNAPPVGGAANRELIKTLSRLLGLPPSKLAIIAGEHARDKDVLLDCTMTEQQILDRMGIPEAGGGSRRRPL